MQHPLEEKDEEAILLIINEQRENADSLLSESHLLDKHLNDVIDTMRSAEMADESTELENDVSFF